MTKPQTLLIMALGLFLGSCGDGGETIIVKQENERVISGEEVGTLRDPNIDPLTYGEGLLESSSEYRTTYFNKSFDYGVLRTVSVASAELTLSYITQQLNVAVYRALLNREVNCEKYECLFENYPTAPDVLQSIWDFISQGLQENQQVLGLYIPRRHYGNDFNSQSQATITMNPLAGRRVLLHEMLHHLFESEKQGLDDDVTVENRYKESSRNSMIDLYNSLSNQDPDTISSDQALELYNRAMNSIDLTLEFLNRFAFEEMTVERVLEDEYDQGHLKYVRDYNLDSTIKYVADSLATANGILNDYVQVRNLMEKIPSIDLSVTQRLSSKLNPIMSEMSGFTQWIRQKKNQLEGFNTSIRSTSKDSKLFRVAPKPLADLQQMFK